jgi:hypothetical protein
MPSESYDLHEVLMVGLSILSAVCSATIIMAYALIPAVRKRKYFELVFYIAIGNFLSSIGSSLGFVPDKSPECWIQGVLTNVFSLSSIAWTVVIAITVNHAVMNSGSLVIVGPLIHCVCWLLPVLLTFIPLVQVRMGAEGEDFWCFYVRANESESYTMLVVWRWIGFYAWVLLSVAVIVVIFFNLLAHMKSISSLVTQKAILANVLKKLIFYPLIIIVCWFPAAIYDSRRKHEFDEYSDVSTTALNCLHGTLLGVVFWLQNYEVVANLKRGDSEPSENDDNVQMLTSNTVLSEALRDSGSTVASERMPSMGSGRSLHLDNGGAGDSEQNWL